MEFIRGLHNLRPHHKGCVLTIGAFDGFHLGHRELLRHLRSTGDQLKLPTTLVTLEPLPREFFAPGKAPARLMSLREKIETAASLQVDRMLCIRFTDAVSAIPAREFIEQVFVAQLGVRHIVVGDDLRFGHEKRGDFGLLQSLGSLHGFAVQQAPTVSLDGQRVSSSRIRAALEQADFAAAERLLGSPYAIVGRVGVGQRFGSQLGFPTANIGLYRHRVAMAGVYTVEVLGAAPEPLCGVANVGTRPTLAQLPKPLLEVHLLDFSGDLYGRRLKVLFRHRLRSEQRFASVEQLREHIVRDVADARAWFDANRAA